MDIATIRKKKKLLESEISKEISSLVNVFEGDVGVSVTGVIIEIVIVRDLLGKTNYAIGGTSVQIDI